MKTLVASTFKYTNRDEFTDWLKGLNMKFRKKDLDSVYQRAHPGKRVIWCERQGLFVA